MAGAQISLWDLLDAAPQPAAPAGAALQPESAPAAVEPVEHAGIALQVSEDMILQPVVYEYAEVVLCQRLSARYIGDGILQGGRYLLMRFHEDADGAVYTRGIRDDLWNRSGEQFAINLACHAEAQLFFWFKTRNGRPRHLGKMV